MLTKKHAVTILDIARHAGVSPSTVSRVLNGTTPVAPQKQTAVLKAMKQLDYSPNVVARDLKQGRTSAIGILTQDLSSPFYGLVMVGIEAGLEESSYYPIFASGHWMMQKERRAFDFLLKRRVEALILHGGSIPDEELRQVAMELPMVIIGRQVDGLESQCLVFNSFDSAYRATSYLIERGHRSIAHITGLLSHKDAVDRRNGYCQALLDTGIEIQEDLIVEGDYTERSGLLAVETLFTAPKHKPFTAIFAANDQMAIGARLALYRHGVRVPEDVSLMGFDDQYGSAYLTPPLTTIRQPAFDMGYAAAKTILAMLTGIEVALKPFTIELVPRESVATLHRASM